MKLRFSRREKDHPDPVPLQFCVSCQQEKPQTEWSPSKRGTKMYCKKCTNQNRALVTKKKTLELPSKECPSCGKEMRPQDYPYFRRTTYCSSRCRRRWERHKTQEARECLVCGVDISQRRSDAQTCSREHYLAYRRSRAAQA